MKTAKPTNRRNFLLAAGLGGAGAVAAVATGIRKPDAEYLKGDSEIYAISLDTLDVKALTDRKGEDSSPEASPDGAWIAYASSSNSYSAPGNIFLRCATKPASAPKPAVAT